MGLKDFRTHTMAVEFYKECRRLKLPAYIKDQLLRASSSIALNLAEGSGKETINDQNRFYKYSLTSLREVQSILELEDINHLKAKADHLGACLYKLTAR